MCLFGSGVVVKQGQLGHARNWSGNGRDEMTACVEVSPVSNPELEPLELFQIIIHYVEQHIRKRNLSKDWYTLQVTLNTKAIKIVSKVKATKMKSKYCALIGRTSYGLIWALSRRNQAHLNRVTKITWKIAKKIRIHRFDQYMWRKRSTTPLPISRSSSVRLLFWFVPFKLTLCGSYSHTHWLWFPFNSRKAEFFY